MTPIHLVSKHNNAQTKTGYIDQSTLPPLQESPSSVRVRTQLISLSSNNLTYALAGDRFGWWSAYPVPAGTKLKSAESQKDTSTDADLDLNASWGIVPAWGYALVSESTHASIASGSLLWGFWPTSSHSFDLTLASFPESDRQPDSHFREASPHRANLMAMYNRYVLVSPSPRLNLDSDSAAQTVLSRPVFECGVLLEKYTLHRHRFTHPLGLPRGAPANTIPGVPAWGEKDADLRKAVVVSLSAGTKTARSFAWMLTSERSARGELETEGPRGLVQVTSVPQTLEDFAAGDRRKTKLKVKNVGYGREELRAVVEWVRRLQEEEGVERVVMVDFGAAKEVTEALVEGLKATAEGGGDRKGLDVLGLAVGNESKVYSGEEIQARMASGQALGKVQFNTSGVRDRAAEVEGATAYFDGVDEAWKRCYTETGLGEVRFERYHGVEGANGIEGAWGALCEQKLAPNTGIVVRLIS